MATFLLTVIMDDHRPGQRDCLKKNTHRTLAHLLLSGETSQLPVFRRWLCLALGKLWEMHHDARLAVLREDLHLGLLQLLGDRHVEVRAAALYALGTLFGVLDSSSRPASTSHPSSAAPPPPTLASISSLNSLNLSMSGGDGPVPGSPPHALSRQPSSTQCTAAQGDHEGKRRVDIAVMGVGLLRAFDDASPMVRREAILSLSLLLTDPLHLPFFAYVAHELILFNQTAQVRHKAPYTPISLVSQ